MTSHKIGVNLRVSGNCDQGGRKYMEDYHAIKFIKKDDRDYEFAYFGIFDGHGGPEASRFARDNLLNEITKYDQFWTDNDDDVMNAIRSGFLDTHQLMWKELDSWPRTVSGLPSTSGTTASIAIIKKCKLYIGHVGDSGIVLGCDEGPRNAIFMKPKCLTKDHKPDNPEEKERIERSGGSVVSKAGVQRVVWSRPKVNHKGPIRRSTQIDKIPFLAVARSLGDLWSYDYFKEQFVVSPDPDVSVMTLEPGIHRCLILGSDGLWNMLSPAECVSVVTDLEMHFEDRVIHDPMVSVSYWINPAEKLVSRALNKWRAKMMKADNISCVVVLIDPLGPSKLTILRKRREEYFQKQKESMTPISATASMDGGRVGTGMAGLKGAAVASVTSMSVPSTSGGIMIKANHNQNNLVVEQQENQKKEADGDKISKGEKAGDKAGRGEKAGEKAGKEGEKAGEKVGKGEKAGKDKLDDSDADSENKSKNGEGEGESAAVDGAGGGGGGHSSGGSARQPHSHSLRSSSHSPPTTKNHHHNHHNHHYHNNSQRVHLKAMSASKVGKSHRGSLQNQVGEGGMRYPLSPRRLSHPSLTSSKMEDVMEDSVQASSALNGTPVFGSPLLSSASQNAGDQILNPSSAAHMLPSMSNSLLMIKLNSVKASSAPLPSSVGISVSVAVLKQSHPSGSKAVVGRDLKKAPRHSLQGTLSFAAQQQHNSSFLASAQEVNPITFLPSSHNVSKRFPHHATQDSTLQREPSKDVELESTRILRVATAQRSSSSGSSSSKPNGSSSDSRTPSSKTVTASNSKALVESPAAQSGNGSFVGRIKKRREFGLLYRTRTTLRRARRAACRAFCPENRPFLKQLPGAKRKRDDKRHVSSNHSSAKRLKKNNGLRYSL